MACAACHSAKVKCICPNGFPCDRCVRLDIECVLHKSRQGQGKKKRKKRVSANVSKQQNDGNNMDVVGPLPNQVESTGNAVGRLRRNSASDSSDSLVKTSKRNKGVTESVILSDTNKLSPNHFGLYFIIRQWISFAVTRRSLNLLCRACSLACKHGISMDDVLCGCERFASIPCVDEPVSNADVGNNSNNPLFMALAIRTQTSHGQGSAMEFLSRIITTKASEQEVMGPPLQLTEIPIKLLSSIYNCPSLSNLSGRWMQVREMKKGISRYFVSPQFEQDIASYDLIYRTYIENTIEVKDIWTVDTEEKYRHTQGLIHQISVQDKYDTLPHPARITNTRIRLKNGQKIACDCIVCLVIVGLDHCYYFVEYHSPRLIGTPGSSQTNQASKTQNNNNNNNNNDGISTVRNKPPDHVIGTSRRDVLALNGGVSNNNNKASIGMPVPMNVDKNAQHQFANNAMLPMKRETSLRNTPNNNNNLQQQQQRLNIISNNNGNNNSNNVQRQQYDPTQSMPQYDDYNANVDELEWTNDLDGWLSDMQMKNLW